MTRIVKVLAVPTSGALYHEDLSPLQDRQRQQEAGKSNADIVRRISEAVSIGLVLEDRPSQRRGRIAWGDCVAGAPDHKATQAPPFHTATGISSLQNVVAPALEGRELTSFHELAAEIGLLQEEVEVLRPVPPSRSSAEEATQTDGEVENPQRRAFLSSMARLLSPYPDSEEQDQSSDRALAAEPDVPMERVTVRRQLHPALRYGVSQALLQAMALARDVTMTEIIASEWDLPLPEEPIPVHAQTGNERYLAADKMIVHRIASLPHKAMDDLPDLPHETATKLVRYARWLKERIPELAGEGYVPTLYLDMQGALGELYENNLGRVLGQIYALELSVQPFPLRIANPVILESREAQMEALQTLRRYVEFRKMSVQLVADAWVNTLSDVKAFVEAQAADMIHLRAPDLGSVHHTVEAVRACQAGGLQVLLGGSAAETDLSARVTVHVALATRPDLLMAKPGLGVDEAIMFVQNEMARTLAALRVGSPLDPL